MLYSKDGKPNLKHSDSGEVYNGPIMFVAFNDKQEPTNIKDMQIKAIKAVYKVLK